MKLTFTEYISQYDFLNMTVEQRNELGEKWAEYHNAPFDMTKIIAMKGTPEGAAFDAAIKAIYFADKSDYKSALYEVIMALGGLTSEEVMDEEIIKNIFKQL